MDKSLFKHCIQISVRSYEIDWQGIVHNANYLHYFEVGRIEYLNAIGTDVDFVTVTSQTRVVLVRNEIDYRAPARFKDVINVYSRVSIIKNSSFVFEGILENRKSHEIVAENLAVHVWLHPVTGKPAPVPEPFRKLVRRYEGKNCVIERPKIIV